MQTTADMRERNQILAALAPDEWAQLRDQATLVTLPAGCVLAKPGEELPSAYFPVSGLIVTFAVQASGDQIAVALIGSDAMIGAATLMGITRAPREMRVQVDTTAYQMPAGVFAAAFDRWPSLRQAVLTHIGRILADVARLVPCSRLHTQRERLAGWLLMMTRKIDQASVSITHELLSQMLGGPRHAISQLIADFRANGLVEQERGAITVIDADALAAIACDCLLADGASRGSSNAQG